MCLVNKARAPPPCWRTTSRTDSSGPVKSSICIAIELPSRALYPLSKSVSVTLQLWDGGDLHSEVSVCDGTCSGAGGLDWDMHPWRGLGWGEMSDLSTDRYRDES